MSKANKNKLLPKLRFPEFIADGEWKTIQLSELLFETKKRNRNLKYSRQDVLSVSGEYGCVNQIELLGRSYAGVSVKDYHVVETGDIVYTKSPLKKNPYGIIKENKGKPGIVSTLYAVYRPKENGHSTFLEYYFSNDYRLNSYLEPIVRKGAKNDMKVNNFAVLEGLIVAPLKPEQQKIADCLSSIDDLITAESQKLETVKEHKKGLLQKLFPSEGEVLPLLRFKEFRDDGVWDEKKLGRLSKSFSGGTPTSTEKKYYGGNIPFIRSAEIAKEFTELFITKEGLKNSSAKIIKKGDLLIALYGANSCEVALAKIDGAINQAILCLRSVISNSFIYHYLTLKKDWITSKYIQGGQGNLSGEIVKSIKIPFPEPKEQQKIADCLSLIDDLISAQNQKIETLRLHKKGLMQQLFPELNNSVNG